MARAEEDGESPRRGKRQKGYVKGGVGTAMATTTTAATGIASMAATATTTVSTAQGRARKPSKKAAEATLTSAGAKESQNKKKKKDNEAATATAMTTMTTTMTRMTTMAVTATAPTTLSLPNQQPCTSCAWSVFKACSPFLEAPLTCTTIGCTAAVHTICQAIWENKNGFKEDSLSLHCPRHHPSKPIVAHSTVVVAEASTTMLPTALVVVAPGAPAGTTTFATTMLPTASVVAPAAAARSTTNTLPGSCVWSRLLGAPGCDLSLPDPVKCTIHGCNYLVHHLCVIQWEGSQGYEGTPRTVCPGHHDYYNQVFRDKKMNYYYNPRSSSSAISTTATTAAAAAASTSMKSPTSFPTLPKYQQHATQPPPI
jgi:hypothetical protein